MINRHVINQLSKFKFLSPPHSFFSKLNNESSEQVVALYEDLNYFLPFLLLNFLGRRSWKTRFWLRKFVWVDRCLRGSQQ